MSAVLEKAAADYIRAAGIAKRESERQAEAGKALREANEILHSAHLILQDSVQPNCGSATKPWRRIYRIATSPELLIVEWDDHSNKPSISLTKAETL